MRALLQRVAWARVEAGSRAAAIGPGLLVLLGIERGDEVPAAESLARRLLDYRIFADDQGRMTRSLAQTGGGLMLIPQFTLVADTRKGLRPNFGPAAPPAQARELYQHLLDRFRQWHDGELAEGFFGEHMQVHLVNDGPVSFVLESRS